MKNLLLKLFVLIGIFVWTTTSYGQFVTETVCTTTTVMPADGEVFTDPTDGVTGGPGGDCTTTSSGDPGDYPNSNCVTVTTLSAPPGSQISVTFTSFRVNGSFDWLSIFDGDSAVTATNGGGTATNPSSPDPELWRSTSDGDELIDMTNAGMTTFTSTNGSLTFAFRTSSVVQTCGWEATIAIIGGPGGGGGDITECGNAPEPIPATGTSGLMTPSVASVTGTGNIGTDYSIDNVTINLDHTFAADVEMVLVSPTGTRLALCTDNGGSSAFDTAVDLVFTDASANNITDLDFGDPVEADYRAEGGANAFPVGFGDGPGEDMNTVFSGESITGDWTLEINDDAGGDSGNLNSFCINLVDLTAPGPDDPIIVCPSDVMSNSDPGECGAVVNFATPGAIDPNGGTVTVTQTMGPASGSLFPIGDTIVEFTATNDEAPNETSTCQFTVTVVDNEAPTITCPADITQTNDPGVCGANITVPMPTIMDNCPVMANNPPPSVQGPVTDFIFDAAGLADTPTTLVGTQMSTGGDVTMSVSFNGDFGGSFEAFILNGPDGTEVYNNQDVLSDCGGPFNFEFTIAEADWNNYVTTFGPDLTFTLLADPDVDGPALCAPDNFYQLAAEQGMATGPTLTNDYNGTNDASGFYPVGDTDVTFTYTDGAGNSASCTMTVTVTDDEAPVVMCEGGAGTFTVTEDFDAGLPAGWSSVINSGTCDFMNVSTVPIGADFSNYPAMVFDDDACGNGAPASNVSILSDIYDTSGSNTITLEYEYGFYEFSGGETFTVEVWDGAAWQQVAQYAADTDPTVETVDASAFANADFQVRWTFDDNGAWGWYAGMDSFSLTYDVLAGPPFDIVLDANGMATVNVSDLVTVTDNCGNTTATAPTGNDPVPGSLTTTFAGGNGIRSMMFDINVLNDATIDSFEVNLDDNAVLDIEVYAKVGTHVGSENTPGDWTLIGTQPGVVSAGDGMPTPLNLTLDYAVTAGQTYAFYISSPNKAASLGFNYTNGTNVGDVFVADSNIEILEGSAVIYPFGTIFAPRVFNGTVEYTAGGAGGMSSVITFDCEDVGESQIEVTVTDDAGNTSVCTATINVIDDTAPVLVCQDFTLELGPDGTAMLDPFDLIDMTATFEACGIDTAAVDIDDFSCDDIGTPIEVTLFVADPSLNTAACTAMVTVVDLLAPEVTCPADQTVDPGPNNQLYEVPDYFATGEATALDNCTDPVTIFTQDPAAGALIGDGTYTVTLTAEDEYGNIGTCTFELTVESVLGVEESSLEAGVTMYPNPAQAEVTIANNSNILLEKATMYDVNGKLVNTTDLSDMTTEKTIDISQLASGVYIVQIESENASVVKRLIKE